MSYVNIRKPIRSVFSRQITLRISEERVLTRILGKFDLRLFWRHKTSTSETFETAAVFHV